MDRNFMIQVGEVCRIKLSGRLDAVCAPALMEELKGLAGKPVKKIVFMANELEYISSAGLRAIIFAKQKIGMDARVYLIGAQDAVVNVVRMSGLDNFLHIQDTFTEA